MELSAQQTLPGIKPRRSDAVHASRADKQAAYRERNKLKPVVLQLPIETADRLDAYLAAKGKSKEKSAIVAKLIETQLLRKR
jgi:predicted DNA-binding protein